MYPRRHSEDNLVTPTAHSRATRVLINMALDITVILDSPQAELDNLLAQHQVQQQELDYVSTLIEAQKRRSNSLTGVQKITKPKKSQHRVAKDVQPAPSKTKQFTFIDEVCTFGSSGKTMIETCDYNRKKQKPGFDELSKMFTFK